MRDLYRGDGGRLSSYDEGWNDGVEAASKAAQPSGYIIEEVSSGGYSVGGAGGSGPSAISDEADYKTLYLDLIMQVSKKYPGETRHDSVKKYIRFCETPIGEGHDQAAAQEGK